MVTVALAGATTGFGLTMLHAFIHLKRQTNSQHNIVLLSRSSQPQFTAAGVDVRPVDYTNHAQLVAALQGVHTLLSTVGGQGIKDAQLALIAAAQEAGVKRFAPSEFAGTTNDGIDLYQPKESVWQATRESGMEYTRFACGLFMSLLATGTPKPRTEVGVREGKSTGEEEALAGLRPWNFEVNIRDGTIDMTEDGTAPFVMTDMRDIAHFVWRALDLQSWPETLGMRGDVKSFSEIVTMLEGLSGRKFLVRQNSLKELEDEAARNPKKQFYNQVRIRLAQGAFLVPNSLNKAFPEIKPITCEEFIGKWWSAVELGAPAWSENKLFDSTDF